jgi:hypothetical protein
MPPRVLTDGKTGRKSSRRWPLLAQTPPAWEYLAPQSSRFLTVRFPPRCRHRRNRSRLPACSQEQSLD